MTRAGATIALLTLAVALGVSCDDKEPAAIALLGGSCRLNSDCNAGLVCAYGICHEECASSKDCDGRCVVGPNRVKLCQPDGAAACSFHSECDAPLVCGIDGACRNECNADRDCLLDQTCTAAVCADSEELDDAGQLPPSGDAIGKPCRYSSDCPPAEDGLVLVCRDGTCNYGCFEERDCGRFFDCTTADDPTTPGNCELIGTPGQMYCDPDEGPQTCDCPGGTQSVQNCLPDGSGYDTCQCA